MVVRETEDPGRVDWFKGQSRIARAMGILYKDVGQLRVVNVQPKVSIAEVNFSCADMIRGDIVRPFEERPAPPYKEPGPFDHLPPVRRKPVGIEIDPSSFPQTHTQATTTHLNLCPTH